MQSVYQREEEEEEEEELMLLLLLSVPDTDLFLLHEPVQNNVSFNLQNNTQ